MAKEENEDNHVLCVCLINVNMLRLVFDGKETIFEVY